MAGAGGPYCLVNGFSHYVRSQGPGNVNVSRNVSDGYRINRVSICGGVNRTDGVERPFCAMAASLFAWAFEKAPLVRTAPMVVFPVKRSGMAETSFKNSSSVDSRALRF